MARATVHEFTNGVKVYDHHLSKAQRKRYKQVNVHEPEEEELFTRLVKAMPQDAVFVDVGSAIGYYVILARLLSPSLRVFAVEPLSIHRAYCEENLKLNGIQPESISVYSCALSDREGTEELEESSFSSVLAGNRVSPRPQLDIITLRRTLRTLLTLAGAQRYQRSKSLVPTTTLDALVEACGHVDLLLMDIQGSELNVLKSGSSALSEGLVSTFLIGTHTEELHDGCQNRLTQFGYIIDVDKFDTQYQPDGIIVASTARRRLI